MKLDKIDMQRIYDNQPSYLRLYNINSVTEDERKYLQYMPMFVNKIFISTKDKDIIHDIELQFPNTLQKVVEYGGLIKLVAERNKLVIDLDITTKCNLTCANCSRFSNLSSTWTEMSMAKIYHFISENKHYGKSLTVKIIGGEPTVHPLIDDILFEINKYFHTVLVTNGVKDYKPKIDICVENSGKWVGINPGFWSTCDAPQDDEVYKYEDYSLGCDNSVACGNGYTEDGYYPCTIAGSIDRMLREPGGPREGMLPLGADSLEEAITNTNKDLVFNKLCRYCGFYKRMGFNEAYRKDFERTTKQYYSKSWKFMEGRK
jgi:hypothetical protein